MPWLGWATDGSGVPESPSGSWTEYQNTSDRTYVRRISADVEGTITHINLRIGPAYNPGANGAFGVVYRQDGGSGDIVKVGQVSLGSQSINSWTGYLELSAVSGQNLDFESGDVLFIGLAFDGSGSNTAASVDISQSGNYAWFNSDAVGASGPVSPISLTESGTARHLAAIVQYSEPSSYSSSSTSFSSSSSSSSFSSSSFSSSSSSSSSESFSSSSSSSASVVPVVLDSDFDHGNGVEAATFENPSGTFNIKTEKDAPSNNWSDWFFFKLSGVNGRAPVLKVDFNAPSRWSSTHGNVRPVWSYDGETWSRLSSIDGYSDGVLTFTLPAMEQSSVYVAMDIPYPWSKVVDDVEGWGASSYCTVTELSYGGLTGSSGGRPVYHLRIEDTHSHYANKLHAVITCRSHPGEPQPSWSLKGMIDWILGSDAAAVALREKVILDVFPCVNPDGVYMGKFRSFGDGTTDGNRGWSTSGPNSSLEQRETFLIHSKIHEVRDDVDFCIDLHSSDWTDVKLCEDAAGACPRFGTTLETAIKNKVDTYDTGNYFDSDVLYRYDSDTDTSHAPLRYGQGIQYGYPHILMEGGIYTTDGGAYPTSAQREAGGVALLRSVLEALESASYSSTSFSSSSSSLSSSSSSSSESSSSSSSSSTSFSSSSFSSSSSSSSSTSFSFSSSSFSESCMLFVRTRHAVGAWTKTEQPCVRTRN